jgi:hypothetical protein
MKMLRRRATSYVASASTPAAIREASSAVTTAGVPYLTAYCRGVHPKNCGGGFGSHLRMSMRVSVHAHSLTSTDTHANTHASTHIHKCTH